MHGWIHRWFWLSIIISEENKYFYATLTRIFLYTTRQPYKPLEKVDYLVKLLVLLLIVAVTVCWMIGRDKAQLLLFICFSLISVNSQIHNKGRSNNRINSGIADSGVSIDVSSPEFKSIAAQTYAKVLPCVLDSWMMKDRNKKDTDFQFPDDAQFHFERVRNITSSYRYAPVHEYAGYEGKNKYAITNIIM